MEAAPSCGFPDWRKLHGYHMEKNHMEGTSFQRGGQPYLCSYEVIQDPLEVQDLTHPIRCG